MSGIDLIHDTLKVFSEKKAKIYCKWIYCIKENCAEGYNGICNLPNVKKDYPDDGKCYDPHFESYDEELEKLGAFE